MLYKHIYLMRMPNLIPYYALKKTYIELETLYLFLFPVYLFFNEIAPLCVAFMVETP